MSATFRLPPSERDFELFFEVSLETLSTRQAAEHHKISQTRVRQLVVLVADWLAEHLPETSETDLKKQVRLAQHIAAGRLEHQYEQAMRFWNNDYDPKYLRQATRIALAQARLGVVAGRLHAIAGDALEGPAELGKLGAAEDHLVRRGSPDPAALPTGGLPVGGQGDLRSAECHGRETVTQPAAADRNVCPTKEDCSPKVAAANQQPSEQQIRSDAVHLEGARIMESRLLTLIADQEGNHQKVAYLNETLAKVRSERAELELRLAPYIVGAEVQHGESSAVKCGDAALLEELANAPG